MRVLLMSVFLGSAIVSGACSDGPTPLRRNSVPSTSSGGGASGAALPPAAAATGGSGAPSPTPAPSAAPTGTGSPAPTPSASASPSPPASPPAPGSCGAPKCLAGGGLAGCKATDAQGNAIALGCQDGTCACFSNDQAVSTFDGDPQTPDDAKSLFLTNCTCD